MNSPTRKLFLKWIGMIVMAACAVGAMTTAPRWFPILSAGVERSISAFRTPSTLGHDHHEPGATDAHDHAADDHAHDDHGQAHDESTSLHLSDQALQNIGLSPEHIQPVRLTTFRKSITVPALIVQRPGRTHVQVATPMTGVVTRVHAVQGEAVEAGALLFQIRLTHEDLVQVQTDFLKTLGELDVEKREVARLTDVTKSGAVAGRVLLEREYERDKLVAHLQAQREALRLHGLSDEQVESIASDRRLLRELQIFAPTADDASDQELKLTRQAIQAVSFQGGEPGQAAAGGDTAPRWVLEELHIHKGQSVNAGETLCQLADYGELYIEGLAFEQDIRQLRQASERAWTVDAIFDQPGAEPLIVEDLEIAYLANQVDSQSRTLPFYVRLQNTVANTKRSDGKPYVEWTYLPGQRLQLRVPVEEWPQQIVLPIEALAREGAEFYVFQQNGDHFDRVPVHVTFRDQHAAVIAADGSLFPGDVVALRGAHQMQIALKNKAGGGVDPHAGHHH